MLPSSGYFKNIPCPFFKNGLCERHHCHYGHTKNASSSGRSLLGRCLPESNKDVLDVLDKVDVLHNATSIEPAILNECTVTYGQEQKNLDYIPTPVPKAPSILKKSKTVKHLLTAVPEYKPTPISRLKPLGISDSSEENSLESLNISSLSKKRRKVEEYDPTEVKCSFKKKVSFNLPEDDKDGSDLNQNELPQKSVPCIVIDSSDDELDVTPKFSDDEEEEGHTSDDASPPVVEIKKEKPDTFDFQEYEIDIAKICDFNQNQIGDHFPISSPEIRDFPLVDKLPVKVKEEDTEDVHKTPVKAISTHTDTHVKSQKSLNSEVQRSQKSHSSKDHTKKPQKSSIKLKQESSSDNVSHSRLSEEKLHKDGLKQHANKQENVSKHTTTGKKKSEEPLVCSSKPSEKTSVKKNKAEHQNKVVSASERHSKESRSKLQKPKVEADHGEMGRKEHITTKHCDSLKSKNSTKDSDCDSKSMSKNKTKSHDKGTEKVIKAKDVKIQDEKVSSSCQASHKKHVASDKRHSSSPPKKKPKLQNDEKTVVKPKSSSEVRKPSRESEFSKSEVNKNSDKEVQCNVQDDSNLNSALNTYADSDDYVHFPASDSDMDSDTFEECLRFFNEHEESQAQKKGSFEVQKVKEEKKENMVALVKKRVAHQMDLPKPKVPKHQPQVNPSHILHNRFIQLQEMYSRQNVADEKKVPSAFVSSLSRGIETYKRRITVAPSAGLVAAVTQKQKQLQSLGTSSSLPQRSVEEITYVVTETKRVARVPAQAMKPRPIIPVEYGCKVPSNVRQRYLNNFIDECLKFCADEDEAYQTALDEEKKAYERSSNKTVYLGVAINTLKRLRHQATEVLSTCPPPSSLKSSDSLKRLAGASHVKFQNKTISHEMMLGGARAQRTSFSIEKKKPKIQDMEIKGKMLYEALTNYVLSSEQLVENGYPLPHPTESGRALVSGIYVTKRPSSNDPFKRVCNRCQKFYQVDASADYIKVEECEYHWGHLWQKRIGRSMERQYSCCGGDSQSDGCCIAPGHVFDGNESETLKGYVKTMPKSPPPDGYFGVYALDCEMCYTSAGIELIRVTVINPEMKAVYESFVKPENKILDYNTRFSGITEEDLADVETSLRDVQAVLLCLFNCKTILIGHSLESDFKALKLIHTTVVDTAVVFPHKRGLPYKRALRTLMAEYMRKIIQNSLNGHDSNEDAVSCMELMLWKIKEDLKRTR